MDVAKGRRRDAKQAVKKELGERIVLARERRGWSQKELASRLDIPRERLGAWERGRNAPGVEDLALLSAVPGVMTAPVFEGDRMDTNTSTNTQMRQCAPADAELHNGGGGGIDRPLLDFARRIH